MTQGNGKKVRLSQDDKKKLLGPLSVEVRIWESAAKTMPSSQDHATHQTYSRALHQTEKKHKLVRACMA